jgi:hypothetical protein
MLAPHVSICCLLFKRLRNYCKRLLLIAIARGSAVEKGVEVIRVEVIRVSYLINTARAVPLPTKISRHKSCRSANGGHAIDDAHDHTAHISCRYCV